MQTTTITITPKKAKEFLTLNKSNRPLKKGHIAFLAQEMKAGNWKNNGESIKFSKKKRLLDGQHRLHGVVKSGVSIKSVVQHGLDDDVFDTLDTGHNRTGADVLSLSGEKNATQLSALLKALVRYYDHDWTKPPRMSNVALEQALERFPDAREVCKNYELKCPGLFTGRIIHFCYYVFSKKNKEQALEFMTKLCTGEELAARSPIMAVRTKVMEAKLAGTKYHPDEIIKLVFRAWNLYRDGKTTTRMKHQNGQRLEKAA